VCASAIARLFDWAARLESGRAWGEREPETETTRAEEIVMLGLRLASGLRASDYESSVWHDVVARFGRSLERAVTTGRLIAEPGGRTHRSDESLRQRRRNRVGARRRRARGI
jgi:hypothetical protein